MTWEKVGDALHAIEGDSFATIEPWCGVWVLDVENAAKERKHKQIVQTVREAKVIGEKVAREFSR